jgi:hypothetical protein
MEFRFVLCSPQATEEVSEFLLLFLSGDLPNVLCLVALHISCPAATCGRRRRLVSII